MRTRAVDPAGSYAVDDPSRAGGFGRLEMAHDAAELVASAYKASVYMGAPAMSTAQSATPPTRTLSLPDILESLVSKITEALDQDDAAPLLPDPRPLDAARLMRLRRVGRSEGSDLTSWYAGMLDEDDR